VDTSQLAPHDPGYPSSLLDLASAPVLRVRGAVSRLPSVAIVGARDCSEPAREFAHKLGREICAAGFAVWSGGALGIDAAAHEGAIEQGPHTVVVLGSGLLHASPPENSSLFKRIVDGGGAIVSQFFDDEPPVQWRFFKRNAVLAAATELTIVVECELQSGARNTSAHARRLGRSLAAVVQPPWSARGKGCFEEVRLGAVPLRSVEHALDLLLAARHARCPHEPGWGRPRDASRARAQLELPLGLDELQKAVVKATSEGATNLDLLCQHTGHDASAISIAVLELTLRGVLIVSHQGLRLAAAPPPREAPAP